MGVIKYCITRNVVQWVVLWERSGACVALGSSPSKDMSTAMEERIIKGIPSVSHFFNFELIMFSSTLHPMVTELPSIHSLILLHTQEHD